MSDENEEHEEHIVTPMGIFSKEQYNKMLDQHKMEQEATSHATAGFVESLSEDQLRAFRVIIDVCRYADDNSALGYYAGLVSSALHYKFGTCVACGQKHDEQLAAMTSPREEEVVGEAHLTDREETMQNADIYQVAFITDSGEDDGRPLHLTPVACLNECGKTWPNMEQRMLTQPGADGCDGCQRKAMYG